MDTIETDAKLKDGDRVALVVNGLGSTPPMELSIVARSAVEFLEAKGIVVERAWAGTFLSALDMPGFSLSVMQVDDDVLGDIDYPTDATAWPRGGAVNSARVLPSDILTTETVAAGRMTAAGAHLQKAAKAVAEALVAAEPRLTELDSIAGDGDLGASMMRGSQAVLALPDESFSDVAGGLMAMANAMRKAIGGSSGPFYAAGLMRASRNLTGMEAPTARQMADAFIAAIQAICDLGGAKPGDRTMIDALVPAAEAFAEALDAGKPADLAWKTAVEAGQAGAEATRDMHPRAGRASYLGDRAIGHPDGGAVAVSIWLKAIQ